MQRSAALQFATIEALALAIDARDRASQSQVRREQRHAAALARAFGMPDDEIEGVRIAALLHDIGKLAVPDHILSKPGALTDDERTQDAHARRSRRRDHRERALPLPGGLAHRKPPRALGRQRLPCRPARRRHPAGRAHPLRR